MNTSIESIATDIWNTYQLSLPVYKNNTLIYHCDIPVFPKYKKLCDALVFIRSKKAMLYESIASVTKNKLTDEDLALVITAIDQFIEASPDEYKSDLHMLMGMVITAYLRNK